MIPQGLKFLAMKWFPLVFCVHNMGFGFFFYCILFVDVMPTRTKDKHNQKLHILYSHSTNKSLISYMDCKYKYTMSCILHIILNHIFCTFVGLVLGMCVDTLSYKKKNLQNLILKSQE